MIPLTDGDANPAFYEHDWAATALAIPLAEPHDLELRGDRLRLDGRPGGRRLAFAVPVKGELA